MQPLGRPAQHRPDGGFGRRTAGQVIQAFLDRNRGSLIPARHRQSVPSGRQTPVLNGPHAQKQREHRPAARRRFQASHRREPIVVQMIAAEQPALALPRHYPHSTLDSALRSCASGPTRESLRREWALIDTRGHDPGEYFIRAWIGATGIARPLEPSPGRRVGGVIGLLTLHGECISTRPCPRGVDDGAGLLLVGFDTVLALPLPAAARSMLEANWLLVFSSSSNAFPDVEIECIMARIRTGLRRSVPSSRLLGAVSDRAECAPRSGTTAGNSAPIAKKGTCS